MTDFTVINKGDKVVITALVMQIPEEIEFEHLRKKIYKVKKLNFSKQEATIFDEEYLFDIDFENLKFYLNNEHIVF